MVQKTQAHIALLATNLFFAINYTVVKYLLNNEFIKSFGLNLLRVGVCAVLLWIAWLFNPHKMRIERKDYGRFFLCALTGIAINQLMFLKGLSLTYSIHASLLILITPILITVFAAFFLKEKMGWVKIIGLVLGIGGSILLIAERTVLSADASDPLSGDILIIINAISYTIYFILIKPLMLKYPPVMVIRMVFTIGLFLIFPFCIGQFADTDWAAFTPTAWLTVLLLTVFGTFLAYLFNVYGIKVLGASISGAYIYVQPVFAVIIAIIVLGETLDFYKIIAGLLIAAGVYLSNKKTSNA